MFTILLKLWRSICSLAFERNVTSCLKSLLSLTTIFLSLVLKSTWPTNHMKLLTIDESNWVEISESSFSVKSDTGQNCFIDFLPGDKDSEPKHDVAYWLTSWGATELWFRERCCLCYSAYSACAVPVPVQRPRPTKPPLWCSPTPLYLLPSLSSHPLSCLVSRLIIASLNPTQLQAWLLLTWRLTFVSLYFYCQRSGSMWANHPNWSYLRHTRSHQTKLSAPSHHPQLVSAGTKPCPSPP